MTVAGIKTSELKNTISKEIICPNCTHKNTTKVFIIGNYKHLLSVPFFSSGKHGVSICTNCNHTFHSKEMPDSIKLAYYELKEITKTPIWHYTGVILVKSFVLIKIFSKYF